MAIIVLEKSTWKKQPLQFCSVFEYLGCVFKVVEVIPLSKNEPLLDSVGPLGGLRICEQMWRQLPFQ
jgi:hypothetical protein